MSARRTTRRGYLLVYVLLMLPLAAVVLLLLGRLGLDAIYVQRVAGQHADIVAVSDSLTRQLRQDIWSVSSYELVENRLTLQTVGRSGPATVVYTFEPARVVRTTPEGERVWECRRLSFEWRTEAGTRGDVLWLDFREAPPPRVAPVVPRSFAATFVLPGRAGAGEGGR